MRRHLIPILLILVLALLLGGCWANQTTKPVPTKTDVPTITQDEVCALVYNYLEARGSAMTVFAQRLKLLDWLGKCKPYFTASYQGNGKWQVKAVGNDGDGTTGILSGAWGLWNVYEKSGVIEPADDKATELLSYIQRWTIPQATTQQKPAAPPSTPSQSSQRQYYLQQAEYYQGLANSALDMANTELRLANSQLQMGQSQRGFLYQSDMELYQFYMEQYASDQQMANEYLIDAQREP